MSTILKALRRLEEQKSHGAARPLRDEVVLAPKRGAAQGGLARALVAAVVLAGSGTALLWSLRSEPEAETPAVVEMTLPEVAAPPSATTTITVAAPAPDAPSAVVPVPPAPAEFEIVRPDATTVARPLAPLPLPTIQREEVLAEVAPRPAGRSVIRPPPEEYVEEPLEEAPTALESRPRAGAAVRVARTLWHPSPERRLAWVEIEGQTALREVREGERIGSYLVREIEPAGVVFRDGDIEMRREVGP